MSKHNKKVSLHRETLRHLSSRQLAAAAGGAIELPGPLDAKRSRRCTGETCVTEHNCQSVQICESLDPCIAQPL